MRGSLSPYRQCGTRDDCDRDTRGRQQCRLLYRDHGRSYALCLREQGEDGALFLFIRHTSASLVVQENADPDVRRDLVSALDRLVPTDAPWVHDVEGPDDMPAHVKTMLTGVSLHIPVVGGALALGTWQGIFIAEHRARPHRREIVLQFIGSRR